MSRGEGDAIERAEGEASESRRGGSASVSRRGGPAGESRREGSAKEQRASQGEEGQERASQARPQKFNVIFSDEILRSILRLMTHAACMLAEWVPRCNGKLFSQDRATDF